MLVKYKTVVPAEERLLPHLEMVGYEACCDGMKKAMGRGQVSWGEDDYIKAERPMVSLCHRYWCYDDTNTDYYNISFCPFCGAGIRFEEAKRVKLVTETKTIMVPETRTTQREEPL
jgi:hypothetical protein